MFAVRYGGKVLSKIARRTARFLLSSIEKSPVKKDLVVQKKSRYLCGPNRKNGMLFQERFQAQKAEKTSKKSLAV